MELGPDLEVQYTRHLEARLADELAPRALGEVEVRTRLYDHPGYGEGIVRYAAESGADLVVLGTRGRTNLRHALLGSTAERVQRQVDGTSVLAVVPRDEP